MAEQRTRHVVNPRAESVELHVLLTEQWEELIGLDVRNLNGSIDPLTIPDAAVLELIIRPAAGSTVTIATLLSSAAIGARLSISDRTAGNFGIIMPLANVEAAFPPAQVFRQFSVWHRLRMLASGVYTELWRGALVVHPGS